MITYCAAVLLFSLLVDFGRGYLWFSRSRLRLWYMPICIAHVLILIILRPQVPHAVSKHLFGDILVKVKEQTRILAVGDQLLYHQMRVICGNSLLL
jgi:hypothetical protein